MASRENLSWSELAGNIQVKMIKIGQKRRWGANKRGYFFVLDALLALGVLVMGVSLLLAAYTRTPEKGQTTNLAEDVLDFFAKTKIEDFNNPYFGPSGTLVREGYIKDEKKTLLQQLGEFYVNGDLDTAEKLITNVTENLIQVQYKYEFSIEGIRVYPQSPSQEFLTSKNNAKVLFPSKKFSFGTINNTLDLFGPYEVEVLVWQ